MYNEIGVIEMLGNIPSEMLMVLMGIIPVLSLIGGLVAKSIAFIKYRKTHQRTLIIILAMNIFSILVTVAAFVFNMGWVRFFLVILSIPFIHSFIYTITNIVMIKAIDKSLALKIISICSFAAYVLAYAFLPDGGDYGGMYCFFGLIRDNEILINICMIISEFMSTCHIVLYMAQVVLGIIFAINEKKQKSLQMNT